MNLSLLNSKTLVGNVLVWFLWAVCQAHGIDIPAEAGLIAGGGIALKETARRLKQ